MLNIRESYKYYTLYALLFAAMIASFFYDGQIVNSVQQWRTETLDMFFMFITHFFFVFSLLVIFSLFTAMYNDKIQIIFPLWLSAILAGIFSYILKYVIYRPRPEIIGLISESTPAFPSFHAAVIFATLPLLFYHNKFSKSIKWLWLILALFVSFSRLYAGVHFLSDIIGGAILGLVIGQMAAFFTYNYNHFNDVMKREVKRQLFHLLLGLLLVLLIYFDIVTDLILFAIVALGLVLSYISRESKVPVFHWFLQHFERPAELKKYPGKGTLFYFLGITLTVMIFEKSIALTALMIFALGDSISHIVGRHFGRIKIPYSKHKLVEGSIAGWFFAALGAMVFVKWPVALIGAAIAMAIESIEMRFGGIRFDDNLVMPVITAIVISALLVLF